MHTSCLSTVKFQMNEVCVPTGLFIATELETDGPVARWMKLGSATRGGIGRRSIKHV